MRTLRNVTTGKNLVILALITASMLASAASKEKFDIKNPKLKLLCNYLLTAGLSAAGAGYYYGMMSNSAIGAKSGARIGLFAGLIGSALGYHTSAGKKMLERASKALGFLSN